MRSIDYNFFSSIVSGKWTERKKSEKFSVHREKSISNFSFFIFAWASRIYSKLKKFPAIQMI